MSEHVDVIKEAASKAACVTDRDALESAADHLERLEAWIVPLCVEMMVDKMSDISEEHYCAGWMSGTEYALWDAVTGKRKHWGQVEFDQREIAKLKLLSDIICGWVVWDDDKGSVRVPMDEWLETYAKHSAETEQILTALKEAEQYERTR